MLQPWHTHTCTPTCLLRAEPSSLPAPLARALLGGLHWPGGTSLASPARERGLRTCRYRQVWHQVSCPVNRKGCVTSLSRCPPPQSRLMCFAGSMDSCGLRCPRRGPELAPNAERNSQPWISAWYATGCQSFDSLFLMKIPPVIPRISCSEKMSCVCILLWAEFFSCSSQFPPWTEREGRGKQLTAFFVVVFLLDFCEVCGDQSLATNKCFCFSLQKHMGTAGKAYGRF